MVTRRVREIRARVDLPERGRKPQGGRGLVLRGLEPGDSHGRVTMGPGEPDRAGNFAQGQANKEGDREQETVRQPGPAFAFARPPEEMKTEHEGTRQRKDSGQLVRDFESDQKDQLGFPVHPFRGITLDPEQAEQDESDDRRQSGREEHNPPDLREHGRPACVGHPGCSPWHAPCRFVAFLYKITLADGSKA